ncbi:hypothetical protein [Vibrio hepatarius]|uniref:hypothetical protein n=1 Tax=Vibrio hepatarius TaxID=171383 RepID=UPI001C0890F8|nr:hypothetical protein [Vibrio hepatarius]MBU2898271.1 hypothetical protein [Vibrio hepatarius]
MVTKQKKVKTLTLTSFALCLSLSCAFAAIWFDMPSNYAKVMFLLSGFSAVLLLFTKFSKTEQTDTECTNEDPIESPIATIISAINVGTKK